MQGRTIIGAALLLTNLAVSQTFGDNYQRNSAESSVHFIGGAENHDGTEPLSEATQVGGSVSLIFRSTLNTPAYALVTGSEFPIKSKIGGAHVTAGNQVYHLSDDPDPTILEVESLMAGSGEFTLTFASPAPGSVSLQLVMEDPTHPDGFRLSSVAIAWFSFPEGSAFSAPLDLGVDRPKVVDVIDVIAVEPLPGEPSYWSSIPIADEFVEATFTCLVGGSEYEAAVQIHRDSADIYVDGSVVTTLEDIFSGTLPSSGVGTLELSTEVPISIDSQVFSFSAMGVCKFKTQRGKPVTSFAQAGNAQLEAIEDATFAGLPAGRKASPDSSYNCAGLVFTGPGVFATGPQLALAPRKVVGKNLEEVLCMFELREMLRFLILRTLPSGVWPRSAAGALQPGVAAPFRMP